MKLRTPAGKSCERAEVKVLENFLLLDGEKVGRDFRIRPARETPLVQFAQYQAQQCRGNGDLSAVGGCGAAGRKGDDPIGHAGRQQRRAQIDHLARLPFAHW